MKHGHVFFDLDRTLWDFDKNSKETLTELYTNFDLNKKGVYCPNEFISQCFKENYLGWVQFRDGKISKEELRHRRFNNVLKKMGLSFTNNLSKELNAYYIHHCPLKTNLVPFALELIQHLSKIYSLHIITNGFEESQRKKVRNSGLEVHFEHIITSDMAGKSKPSPKIFEFSFQQTKATPHESIMIGDDLDADILGAKMVGMDQVYFNPNNLKHNEKITFEVKELREITKFL